MRSRTFDARIGGLGINSVWVRRTVCGYGLHFVSRGLDLDTAPHRDVWRTVEVEVVCRLVLRPHIE